MTGRPSDITEDELHAFVDGVLPLDRAEAVPAFLKQNPDRAEEVEAWRRQNAAIAALFPLPAGETAPARLDPRRIALARDGRRAGIMRYAAAAAILVLVAGTSGWFLRDWASPPEPEAYRLIDSAITAHALYIQEKRHAVEVAANDEDHLTTWLSNRIGQPIGAPDLSAQGYALVGGRLLPTDLGTESGPAAQLMYENAEAQRLTIYVTASLAGDGTTSRFITEHGINAYYWATPQITCTIVGSLPEAAMQSVARSVYTQMGWKPDPTYQRGS